MCPAAWSNYPEIKNCFFKTLEISFIGWGDTHWIFAGNIDYHVLPIY